MGEVYGPKPGRVHRVRDVCWGSKSEVGSLERHVRSTLNTRRRRIDPACPVRATNGLICRSKRHLYSITLSARSSSEDGTARPSALAALRLTISSDLVGACTQLGLP